MFDRLWDEDPRVQQTKKLAKEEAKQEVEQERLRLQQEADQKIEQERLRSQQAQQEAKQAVKILRSSLVSMTRVRFPNLSDFAQQQVEQFDKPEVLDLLIQRVAVASDANMVRLLLNPGAE